MGELVNFKRLNFQIGKNMTKKKIAAVAIIILAVAGIIYSGIKTDAMKNFD